jgi:hypothetical protein
MRSLPISTRNLVAGAVMSSLAACSTQPGPPRAAAETTPSPRTAPAMVAPASSPALRDLSAPALRALPEPTIALPMRESFTVQHTGEAPRLVRRYALQPRERRYEISASLRARSLGSAAGEDARTVEVPPFREDFAVQADPSPRIRRRPRPTWRAGTRCSPGAAPA